MPRRSNRQSNRSSASRRARLACGAAWLIAGASGTAFAQQATVEEVVVAAPNVGLDLWGVESVKVLKAPSGGLHAWTPAGAGETERGYPCAASAIRASSMARARTAAGRS